MLNLTQKVVTVGLSKLKTIISSSRESQTGLWGMLSMLLTDKNLTLFELSCACIFFDVTSIDVTLIIDISILLG